MNPQNYRLTTEHQQSHGIPVLVDDHGNAYGKADILPGGTAAWICVTLRRGTKGFPEEDCAAFLK